MEKTLTYEQVVSFYANKEKTTERLEKYWEDYHQKGGGYISLWRTFRSFGNCGKNDDRIFYLLIQQIKEKGKKNCDMYKRLSEMQSFKGMNENEIFDLIQVGEVPNQKWHVFVAYMAYQELNDRHKFSGVLSVKDFKKQNFPIRSVPCKEFWLWLIEIAATSNDYKIIEENKIEQLYDAACQNNKEQWKKLKNELWEKTKTIIWDELNNKELV